MSWYTSVLSVFALLKYRNFDNCLLLNVFTCLVIVTNFVTAYQNSVSLRKYSIRNGRIEIN